ncbi:hypothetical protein CW714_05610 [Methanophagales archaeon]|nr:MAG: hypothetical protein CW714_05610 [Methanophagales archaeon]
MILDRAKGLAMMWRMCEFLEQISKPEVTTKLFMFFFALLIILDDWILYHVALSRITRTIEKKEIGLE